MVKKVLFSLLMLSNVFLFGQYTQIGNGLVGSANFGPLRTDTVPSSYSKFAFTYPAATLTNLEHNDSISALSFFFDSFDSLRGNCNMRILIGASANASFDTAALNWDSASRQGLVEVYNDNPKGLIGNTPGEVLFLFNEPYHWDTTGGKVNLQVFVSYVQSTNQAAIMQWYVETGFSVPGFVSNNESKFIYDISNNGIDSMTNRTSIFKPTLKLYHPKHNNDLEVNRMYALGTVPTLMNRADSIKAVISNVGKDSLLNTKVYLSARGANSYRDSLIVTALAPYASQMVIFPNYEPVNLGTETLVVKVASDANADNDSLTKDRTVNYNRYSHNDPFAGSSGGIGFNGSTGDFVAKFYVGGTSYINQIKVDFNQAGEPFQLVVWDDDGVNGLPGTELFVSDTSMAINGTFIMPVLPRIAVSGGYFVGIRQTSGDNVSFTFQEESPVRPHTFYFAAPAGDTSWVNFDPGFNFNFNIRPRLQVANDVAVLDFISPQQGDSIQYSPSDSVSLIARVINYGYQNQGNFLVRGQLYNQFNRLETTKEQLVSILAGDTAVVDFGKISRFRLGNYRFRVTTLLGLDSVLDNNQSEIEFYFIKDYDVAVDQIFSPQNGESFDINRDPIQPAIRLANYGVRSHVDLPVTVDLLNSGNQIVHSQTKNYNLGALTTQIVAFDTLYLPLNGEYTMRAYTQLAIDSFPINDTAFAYPIVGVKRDDVLITSISEPSEGANYAKNTTITPFVNLLNDGRNDQDSVVLEVAIFTEDGARIYYDSLHKAIPFFSIKQVLFDPFLLDSFGDYTFRAIVYIADDQLRSNDTMITTFRVSADNDLKLIEILHPKGIIPIGTPSTPCEVVIQNSGLNDAVGAPVTIRIEDNTATAVYTDVINVNLSSGERDTFLYNTLDFITLGDYYVTVTNDWADETERSQTDTLRSTYITRYQRDLSVPQHNSPIDTLELSEETVPSLRIQNLGLDTLFDIRIAVTMTKAVGAEIHRDTIFVNQINPNELLDVSATTVWSWNVGGNYTFTSRLVTTDDNAANNVLSTTFVIAVRRDLAVDEVLAPLNGDNIYKKSIYKPMAYFKNEGLSDLVGVEVLCDVKVGLITIYRDRKTIDLAAGDRALVEFDSSLSYPNVSQATAEFNVDNLDDQILKNDTIITTFNFVQGLSADNVLNATVSVYPNPSSDFIEIDSQEPIQNVSLTNSMGVEVWKATGINKMIMAVPLRGLAKGNYFLGIVTDGGVISKSVVNE
jgi:hypothetical protein